MYYLGLEYMSRCQYELAIYWLGEAEDVYPAPGGRGEIHLFIAKCYIHLKRYRRAINHLHEAIKINPDSRECYTLLNRLTKKGIYGKFAEQARNAGMNITDI
jgi:tetratricopeptide (TPR) repeat protein